MIRALQLSHLLPFFLSLFLLTPSLSAQDSENMVLLGNWDVDTLPRYSDVWGYARDGREYALIGSRDFVHIIDVTDPTNPTELFHLNTFAFSGSTWRDIKVLGDYAYCVTETNEGLQVIDLSGLPATASIVYQSDDDFTRCHNIFIDETSNPPRLYAFGTRPGVALNGYIVYSLADPAVPVLLASVDIDNADDPGLGYIHDGYARNDTLYANHGWDGFYVYDVADPANPVEIGSLTNYAELGYNHSVWATESGRHMVMCDETTGTGVKVISLDKSDPFALDIQVESIFRSASLAPNMASLAHNPYVMGDSVVVMSYYGEGIQVWDITDPTNPFRRGFYDTTPGQDTYGGGIWGAYPWLPSGNILGSDINNGLFIVRFDELQSLPVEYADWSVRTNGKDALLNWSTASEDGNAGWTVEHTTTAGEWVGVGWVASGTGRYSFVHNNPGPGQHFYRLRQQDLDGTESISDLRALRLDGAAQTTLALYPNPAPAAAPVSLSAPAGTTWELITPQGRMIRRGTGNIPTEELRAGIYLVRAAGKTAKLVVE